MNQGPTEEAIREWLRGRLAVLLKCAPETIDVTAPIENVGLDSATAVGVTLDLEDFLGRPIAPDLFYDYPTIHALAAALARGEGTSDQTPPGA